MATEEFKQLTESLFENYVELMTEKTKGFEVKLSFKEYLNFYIEYTKTHEALDLEDLEEDLDSEEEDE